MKHKHAGPGKTVDRKVPGFQKALDRQREQNRTITASLKNKLKQERKRLEGKDESGR
jgi:hypothetical protein